MIGVVITAVIAGLAYALGHTNGERVAEFREQMRGRAVLRLSALAERRGATTAEIARAIGGSAPAHRRRRPWLPRRDAS